jgi:dephospho-CoA kinase
VIKETAILFENNLHLKCFKTITVNAPEKIRIQRVIQRDKATYNSVVERIKNQWTDAMRTEKSNYVIENISIKETEKQVLEIYNDLKKNI